MDGTSPQPYQPKPGDRVRVILEGFVVQPVGGYRSDEFVIGPDRINQQQVNIIWPDASHVVSVERLPDPGTVEIDRGDLGYVLRYLVGADRWEQYLRTDPVFARLAAEAR